jgi:hypothetical protein
VEVLVRLKIAGYTVPVEWRIGLTDTAEAAGMYDDRARQILLDADLTGEEAKEVLIHEVIEAVNGIFNLEMPHHHIQTVSLGLHQALSDYITLPDGEGDEGSLSSSPQDPPE